MASPDAPEQPVSTPPPGHRWIDIIRKTFVQFNNDNVLRLSAALAYYSVFSIAPLLVITLGMSGLLFRNEAVNGQLFDAIKGYVGAQAAAGVEEMVRSASKPHSSLLATTIGSVTLLVAAAGILAQLKDALNTMWGVRMKPGLGIAGFLRNKILNFGMVLVIGFLLLVSLLLSSAISALNKHLESVFELPPWIWTVLASAGSMLAVCLMFAVLFKFLPDAGIRWRDVWVGAVITAVLFELGKTGLGWYLGRESTSSAYGSAASVVLLLLWVYYASTIFLFGAEFTQVHAESIGHRLEPRENAEIAPRNPESPKPAAEEAAALGAAAAPEALPHQPRVSPASSSLGPAPPARTSHPSPEAGATIALAPATVHRHAMASALATLTIGVALGFLLCKEFAAPRAKRPGPQADRSRRRKR